MARWHTDFDLGGWRVSPKLNRISKDNESISIKHKSMAVLVLLADADGELLTRDEIMDGVWPGMEVTDDVLTQSIVELRKAFGDDARHPRIVETIPRVGFRLIAAVMPAEEASAQTAVPSVSRQSFRRHVLFGLAIVAVAIIAWVITESRDGGRNSVITVQESPSIAVLPFVNMSDDPGNEYFSDGISEEIRSLLARTEGLKVIGRSSSNRFEGTNEEYSVIGEALGVQSVVEGSVRVSGEQVRINAQLIDVSDGTQLWGDSYDRRMTDLTHIFEVQDDVAAAIIDALQIHVSENPTRGLATDSAEAYRLFLTAKALLNEQKGIEAMAPLQRATELDPEFGEAYELLAFSYWQQAGAGIPIEEGRRLIMEAASQALDINPDHAFAKALYRDAAEPSEAGQTFIDAYERAWRAQPHNTIALRSLIYSLGWAGYHRDAHRFAKRFVELDPLSSVAQYSLGETLYSTGRTTEAMVPLAIAYELDNQFAKWFVPAVHLINNDDDSAIATIEAALERDGIADSSWVRDLVSGARDPVNGETYLDRRIPEIIAAMPDELAAEWQFILRPWHLYFGYLDRYYEIIFEAGPPKTWTDADIHVWRGTVLHHSGFTAHSKYLEAAESLGVIGVWERHGPPDFCDKVDGQWVCE